MSNNSSRIDMKTIFEKFKEKAGISKIGKVLGRGAFGEVREVTIKNKIFAGKIIKRERDEKSEEEKFGKDLVGKNIIKINKIYTKKIDDNYYDLIVMEKAILRDLGKLNEFFHRHNLLKLIYIPFIEKAGDNLLRFYSNQIINSLETLDRNYYVHFDLKPENLLISIGLIIKLSDFSILRKIKTENENQNSTRIPGGTHGYLSPEYFINKQVSLEDARKQDYFALGLCLFIIKYGNQMLKYKKYEDNTMIANRILDLLQKNITLIQSNKLTNREFIDFLCRLIQYRPKDRPSFEQIYRNKWLNRNKNYIKSTFLLFENDEEKLIMELQKNDFLIQKEKDKIEKEKKIKKDLESKNLKNKINNNSRFRFKKKLKNVK